ncbi:flagellar FlbD family protein [Luteitalea sp.]|uniref:flagellar FlbD family protein n=1 Tax=Luteitalea sp. TaxID=2004800 RepID=UPI0025C4F8E6|nr:flagellar FlbD family protein [Luteitalea sp.]
MIRVTRLDGTPLLVNIDQITWIEFNPDTVIALANGEKLLVRDAPNDIVSRVQDYKRGLLVPPVRERRGEVTALRAVE